MGMTITEKILASHAGLEKVVPGELIDVHVDLALANDITAPLAIEVFDEIGGKKNKTPEDKKILSMYTNAIAKCKPATNIKNLSFSYTKGLDAEELMHEFKRLTTIAESSFDRRAVSEAPEGRAGALSEVDE